MARGTWLLPTCYYHIFSLSPITGIANKKQNWRAMHKNCANIFVRSINSLFSTISAIGSLIRTAILAIGL